MANIDREITVGIIDSKLLEEEISKYAIDEYIQLDTQEDKNICGHGEKILEIISEETNCKKIYISVENTDGQIDLENVIKAIEILKNKKVDIINISIAFLENDEQLEKVVKSCIDEGIIIVAAQENSGATSYPAAYEDVIVGKASSNKNYNSNSLKTADITNKIIKEKEYEKNNIFFN